jgi:hypothetical protein
MDLFKNIILSETQRRAKLEIDNAIQVINLVYNEWKFKKRRKNAVDLITTSVNKISNIDPSLVDHIHEEGKLKLATILMRCMDNPPWKPIESKRKIFNKISPLIKRLESFNPQTSTGGRLIDVIATRLSACISYQDNDETKDRIFVAYEPNISPKYLKYIFGDGALPKKTYKMQFLMLPDEFDSFIEILVINHNKCKKLFLNSIN